MAKSENDPESSYAYRSNPLEYARPPKRRISRPLIAGYGIVGLLALLFAIWTHQRSAQRAKTALNLRQIGLAMIMYSNSTSLSDMLRIWIPQSASNLRLIGLALTAYAHKHDHVFPDSFAAVLGDDLTPNVFVSPLTSDTPATGPTTYAIRADLTKRGHCSYAYFGAGLSDSNAPTTVLASEAQSDLPEGGMNVLFFDGHVEFVPDPAAQQLRAALACGGPVAWTRSGGITRPTTQPTTRP